MSELVAVLIALVSSLGIVVGLFVLWTAVMVLIWTHVDLL